MEDKDESIPPLRSNKLTLPLILSLMGSYVGFLLYGYMFFLITSPFMACTVESLGRRFLLWSGFLMCSISNIVLVFSLQDLETPLTEKWHELYAIDRLDETDGLLTITLIFSMLVSYLGYFQYGYGIVLVHHQASLLMSNLTRESKKDFKLASFVLSSAIILYSIGGMTGFALFACLVDKYGRKCILLMNNTLTFFGSIFLCISNSLRIFQFILLANFLIGIASGMFSCCVPLYLLEISPTPVRGSITAIATLFFTLGIFAGHLLGVPQIWGNKEGFLLLTVVLGTTATFCIVLLLVCPESPRFILIQKKNETKAREVLRSLRTGEDVGNEIRELNEEDYQEVLANEKKMTMKKFLRTQKFRWPIFTVIVLMAGSQLTGINVMFFYAQKVLKVMELPKSISSIIGVGINVVLITTVSTTVNFIEVWGRRVPLIIGYMICNMACILLTFTLEFQEQSYVMCLLSLLFIIIFFIGYMLGPGSIHLVVLGELFLQSTRSSAFTIGYIALWFIRFSSGILVVHVEYFLGPHCLMIYCPFTMATFIYLFYMLPETRGKTFVEIQAAQKEEPKNRAESF